MSNARKILIIDDDDDLRESLSDQFAVHEEFESFTAETAAQGLDAAKADHIDLILLDVGLPDMDGRESCKILRKNGFKSPIIMLTGHDSDADMILGLESGANDYVTKPFNLGVLMARLRAHMRQHDQSEDAAFRVGPYTFKPSAKQLHHNAGAHDILLSDKESAILKHLYRACDAAVSRDVLYHEIWEHAAALHTHTLQTHIYRLRQKIEENPSRPEIIVSENGGYRLVR